MTNEELIATIRNEIERRITDNTFGSKLELIDILAWLDTLESEKPAPKDLEEAAENYIAPIENDEGLDYINFNGRDIKDAFIAGAKWQAEQLLKSSLLPEDTVLFNKGVEEGRRLERDEFENNRLAACNNQTKEEYNRETDFALEIIKKEHRQPTFSDAINYGMQLQKGQMMNNAIECLVCAGMEGDKWIMTYIGSYESMLETCKVGDKVRIIIVKE